MIAGTGLRTVLTLLFTGAALYGLRVLLRPSPAKGTRVGSLLHTAMAVSMALMVWPAGMELPAFPQTLLFSAAALWFAAQAVLRRQDRPGDAAHAVMSAGMAWMVTAMGRLHSPAPNPGHAGHHAAGGGGAMSLTDGFSRGLVLVLAAACVALAWWWLARAFDAARLANRRPEAVQHACHGGMGAGMAVMLCAMA